jgi:4-hydroxybenzoate polyprenyltransferase
MIRFSHSVFALPFALAGVVFAAHGEGRMPPLPVWGWVVVAMVGARSAAMGMNRLVDAEQDRANPRTRTREIPRGILSPATVGLFTFLFAALFVFAASRINQLAFLLSPVALGIVFFYSFTKRFTWTSHAFLGLALAVAPVGGWVAVTGRLSPEPFLLALAVLLWVAGFDMLYALQDLEFDRKTGLHSLPARFGVGGALAAARACHFLAVVLFALLGRVLGLSPLYLVGVVVIAAILVYEHRLVRVDDLTRLDKAFFDMNAVVGLVYLGAAAVGVLA